MGCEINPIFAFFIKEGENGNPYGRWSERMEATLLEGRPGSADASAITRSECDVSTHPELD
jgi:hypothetical protein